MNIKEKWNYLVDLYNKQKYLKEDIIQETWGNIFNEIFGYSKLRGEIDVHRKIQIGSTERVITDIIITDGTKDLFVVELKQHSLYSGENQLFSYLKLLQNDIGILINKKITVYFYDYQKSDNDQLKYEINFNRDSIDGEKFIELFSKPFDADKVREFILTKDEKNRKVLEIKNKVSVDYVLEILKAELLKTYDSSEIEEALANCKINIIKHNIEIKEKEADAVTTDTRRVIYEDNFLKGVKKIAIWSKKPEQINYKIIRAYLQIEKEIDKVTLVELRRRCSDNYKYPDVYVSTFDINFASLKTDKGKSHGKIFEERFGVVTIWEKAREEIEKYRGFFET